MAALRIAATALGTLYGGDAIEWLDGLAARRASTSSSPIRRTTSGASGGTRSGLPTDYLAWSARWIAAAARVLRRDGSLYICGFSEVLADIKVGRRPALRRLPLAGLVLP